MSAGQRYYLPDPSKWPITGSVGLFFLLGGFAAYLSGLSGGPISMIIGFAIVCPEFDSQPFSVNCKLYSFSPQQSDSICSSIRHSIHSLLLPLPPSSPSLPPIRPGPFYDDYYRTHDHLGYIGADRNATVAAHSMYVPPSMFNLPMPPPHHYVQVRGPYTFNPQR